MMMEDINMEVATEFINTLLDNNLEGLSGLLQEYPELVNAKIDGSTALGMAVKTRHLQVTEHLLQAGADIFGKDDQGNQCTHSICSQPEMKNSREFLELISQYGDLEMLVDADGSEKRTPITLATIQGNIDAIQWLLEHGGSYDIPDERGWKAIHYASALSLIEIVRLLIDSGESPDSRVDDSCGSTVLMIALESKATDRTIEFLLEHGASVLAEDANDNNSLYYAEQYCSENPKMIQIIMEYYQRELAQQQQQQQQESSKSRGHIFNKIATFNYSELPELLSKEEKDLLRRKNVQIRFKSEQYLRNHPEIRLLFSKAVQHLLDKKPSERNVEQSLAEFFSQKNLKQVVLGSEE